MKLSEKLAALEDKERADAPLAGVAQSTPTAKRQAQAAAEANGGRPRRGASASRQASKKKVQDLVLTELAPKIAGLTGEALVAEVRGSLDRILQREDVKVSPIGRRRFVQEMIQDILGYGPLDP